MSEDQTLKRARKGTKSCSECRRRKVRCIRSPEDAQTCRRCAERGARCIEQTYSSQPLQAPKLPSRYRISQLESQVATLNKAVHEMQLKLGYQPSHTPEPAVAQPGSYPATDDSDDDSHVSDVLAADQPSHLRSLFQNNWLSVDTRRQDEQLENRKAKSSAHLQDHARQALQKLIPSKEEVSDGSASKWLFLIHTLFPQPFAVKSQHEMLESYDDMHKSDVDVIKLASWLLTFTITAQQMQHDHDSPATQYQKRQKAALFSRAVSDTVESTILSHDRLVASVQGLGMAMHFLRLQVSQGNFQKAWIRLRHVIAIAELMGLRKASQAVQFNRVNRIDDDEAQVQKAQLWESLCSAERIAGMITNIPSGTRRYQPREFQALTVDGVVQSRRYLARITDIAAKIQYLDDMETTESYASALELDRELRVLSSQTPKSWWAENLEHVAPDHVVQFLHYSIMMRLHLTFTVRQDPGDEYTYSRLACMDACECVAQRYQFLRGALPPGVFLARFLDLQAFTATVVLLLTSQSSPSTDRLSLQTDKAKIDRIVGQVVRVMDEKSNDTTGFEFAQHGAMTIRSLSALLVQDYDVSKVKELTLRVPLLGKVIVRRNVSMSQAPHPNNPRFPQIPTEWGTYNRNEQSYSEQRRQPLNIDASTGQAVQPQQAWQWDPLSWSVEDTYENFFLEENFDQFTM